MIISRFVFMVEVLDISDIHIVLGDETFRMGISPLVYEFIVYAVRVCVCGSNEKKKNHLLVKKVYKNTYTGDRPPSCARRMAFDRIN